MPPPHETVPPYLNFAPLENGVAALKQSASRYKDALAKATANDAVLDSPEMKEINHLLLLTERATLREQGLPNRSWYKNQIYAPGAYTGYGVKTLPGVHEAMDQHDWKTADQESPIIGDVLENWSHAIDAAAEKLEAATGK